MEFDLEDPFTGFSAGEGSGEEVEEVAEHYRSDSVSDLFAAESDHMSSLKTLDLHLSLRRDAVSLLLQEQYTCNLDPFVTYLATNYIDRFLSRQELPRDKPRIVGLLAITCLSLASKMKKIDFSIADFQREEGFIYDAQTIQRMELLVLAALEWRMRSITPFSFLRFFLSFFRPKDPALMAALKSRASQIVFKAQSEMKLLDYKPSVIAASALLTASLELYPIQFPSFRLSVSSCSYVHKDEVRQCCSVMDGCDAMASSCDTPATVLRHHGHRHCSSSESERTTVGSLDRDIKKRRVGGVAGDYCTSGCTENSDRTENLENRTEKKRKKQETAK